MKIILRNRVLLCERTDGKRERLDRRNDLTDGTTGQTERLDRRNDWTDGTTGQTERLDRRNDWTDGNRECNIPHCNFPNRAVDVVYTVQRVSRGSVIGKATCYGLDGPGIESRWGTRFTAPVLAGRGDHPAFYTMITGSLSE